MLELRYFVFMGTVTALEIQKQNKERVNVFLDGEYAFSLSLIEAAKLHKDQPLTDDEIARLKDDDSIQQAVDHAARFLSYRPRSTSEVRQNLRKHKYTDLTIGGALDRLKTLGYLDDLAFARFWLENRDTFRPRGPRALQYELQQKGVDQVIIATVLEDYNGHDAARRAAEDQARRLRSLTQQEFQHKLGRFLQRRGFNYETCRDVIEELTEAYVAEDPEHFIDE